MTTPPAVASPDNLAGYLPKLNQLPDQATVWQHLLNPHFQFLLLLSGDGQIIYANQACLNLAQTRLNKIAGRYIWECSCFSHSDTLQTELKQRIHNASSNPNQRCVLKQIRSAQNNLHSLEATIQAIGNRKTDRQLLLIQAHSLSIQQSQLPANHQQPAFTDNLLEREQLDFILNNTPALIAYWDRHLLNQFSNAAYSRWFGKTPEQIKGQNLREVIGDSLYQENLPHIQAVLSGKPQSFIRMIRREAKPAICTELRYLPHWAANQVQGFYVLGIDISDQYHLQEIQQQNLNLLGAINEAIVISDKHRRILYCNPAFEQLTGYSQAEILGLSCSILKGPQTNSRQLLQLKAALLQKHSFHGELINYRKDGSPFWNELSISPIFDSQGELSQFIGIQRDITERKHLEAKLISSEYRFRTLANAAPVLIWLADVDQQFCWVNGTWLNFTGRTLAAEKGEGWLENLHPEDKARCLATYSSHFQQREPFRIETRMRRHDGEFRWFDTNGIPRFTADGVFEGYIGSCVDITEVRDSKVANDFFKISHEIIYSTDLNGIILDVNDRFVEISGYSRRELIGQHIRLLKSGLHDPGFYSELWRSVNETDFWSGEITNRSKTGELYSAVSSISKIRDSNGMPVRYLAIASDITAVMEKRRQLEHLAYYDSLTGLPNRLLLIDRMRQEMAHIKRHGGYLALLFIDLDGFKAVNDNYGHEIGDQLLIAISKKMQTIIRASDTLVRLGGDEFIVMLTELDHPDYANIPILNLLEVCHSTIQIGQLNLQLSASIGVSFYCNQPSCEQDDIDSLIRHADQAMYAAKQAGKNRYHYFDDLTDALIHTRYDALERIQAGLNAGEFVLYFQPRLDLISGQVLGCEALLRWQHPLRGLLSCGEFLPLIQNHPLSIILSGWVLKTALAQLASWQKIGLDLPISINIDSHHFHQADFLPQLQQQLSLYPDFKPGSLQIELLDLDAIKQRGLCQQLISAGQALGVDFVLDNFGSSYSSMTDLVQLALKTVKIDPSFVLDIENNLTHFAVVESLIALVLKLGGSVIATGIETPEQARILAKMGCGSGQGFCFAAAMPAEQIPDWLNAWQPQAHLSAKLLQPLANE